MRHLIPCVLAAFLAATSNHAARAQAPATAACDATELEFWRSSDRIGTARAYGAYLDAYPSGRFAPLARAAIEKVVASGSTAGLSIATLERLLRRSTDTGAVTLRVGEVYFGPGRMTVGWLGAKTQIVLPRGGWVALSATDHDSDHRPAVRMTTLYFGRFERGQMNTLLRYTFNSRTPAEPREQRWTIVDDCLAQARPDTDIWPGRRTSSRQCNAIDAGDVVAINAAPQFSALKASLDAIEMALPASIAARARFSHTDLRSNFLEIERVEFGTPASRPTRWRDWSREYASLALLGFDRQLELDELEPNLLNPRTDTRLLAE